MAGRLRVAGREGGRGIGRREALVSGGFIVENIRVDGTQIPTEDGRARAQHCGVERREVRK